MRFKHGLGVFVASVRYFVLSRIVKRIVLFKRYFFWAFPFRSGLLAALKPFVKNMKASLKTLVSSKLEPEFYSLPYIFFYHKCFDPSGNIPNAVMNFYKVLGS